ncbi:MAG TPA: hypothetical protein VFS49_12070, partial [Croceibacterium sp.]|nr:hypothetical protein [Croceibacterium sp.]
KPKFFQQLRFNPALRQTVRRFELCLPVSFDTDRAIFPEPIPSITNPPDAVVTGIIDDGLAFAHEHFRRLDGSTRVEYFWNQDDPAAATIGLGYGRELHKGVFASQPGMDAFMAAATYNGLVDEDQVYASIGVVDYRRGGHKSLGRRIAHGTHVMHAASALQAGDLPDERPLICVQLPTRAVADTSGTSVARHILDGLVYILKRTDRLAIRRAVQYLPSVVNVSFGNIAGPHDGTSILEAAIDQIITLRAGGSLPRPVSVVFPAGNAHLARCHQVFRLTAAKPQHSLDWRVLPDDATPSSLQIWPRRGGVPPVIRVRITSPDGTTSPWVDVGETFVLSEGASVLCAVTNLSGATTGAAPVAHVWIAPTVTHNATRRVAPSGLWRVSVRRLGPGPTVRVQAWIQRDDRPFGYPLRGRQSRFEEKLYEYRHRRTGRHVETDNASPMKRDGSMNAFATGSQPVVVGGFRRKDYAVWKRSAGGRVLNPARQGPDALGISDDSVAHRGRLAAGTRSGSMVAMNGTSVAAPQVANGLVEAAASGIPADRATVAAEAAWQETLPRPAPPPAKRGGAGRIVWPPLQRFRRYEP